MDVGNISIFETAEKGDFDLLRWIVEYSRVSLNEFGAKHRTVLHYAAISGNPEMFMYLVDRCGLDPLLGDEDLVTPWDIIKEQLNKELFETKEIDTSNDIDVDGFCRIDKYLEDKYGHRYEDFYRNPVRRGFFPDPSICRVGEDYYMVNSSFIFFPSIPISHSKDLIHWEIIGHAITNPEWAHLTDLEGGRGFWAPDISFYKGKFYITATYRLNDTGPVYRRQMVVSSDKPQGPYSKPVFIDEDGIDPSIFNDDDGRRYTLLNRGARIFELDETGCKKISDAKLLYYGTNKRAPEGPHIYKKDGYYYLLQAEGGTGMGHRVTVSRSKELMGVYEPCPYNPIMRQEDEGATLQRCGHGDLVETPDGRWFMVYLCGRKIGDDYSILGRETALDPVTWTADGWPIVNGLKGPSCMQVKPFLSDDQGKGEIIDADEIEKCGNSRNNMSLCGFPYDYMTVRTMEDGDIVYEEPGMFCIKSSREGLSSLKCRNLVLRRQTDFSFTYCATLIVPDMSVGQHAGITGYYDENTFFEFGILQKEDGNHIYSKEHIGDEDKINISKEALPDKAKKVRLCMATDGLKRNLLYETIFDEEYKSITGNDSIFNNGRICKILSGNEVVFEILENVYYLCDEGFNVGKRFTGALVGMYAVSGAGDPFTAKFEEVLYADRN